MEQVKVFSPASVANVGPGYDTFGFAIEGIGDVITLEKRSDSKLVIKKTEGAVLPTDPKQNVATIAIQALLDDLDSRQGFDITIEKSFKPGSGLGSSASSAAGAVFAANQLLNTPYKTDQLLPFVMEGEAFASKSYHADNVAPALFGGFNVVRSSGNWDIFRVPVPEELRVLIIFPDVEIKTSEAKKLIPSSLSVKDARAQWGNVAGVVAALYGKDYALLSRSVTDLVAEPVRKALIPHYGKVKQLTRDYGSAGFNISGSGPSMFAFFTSTDAAKACIPKIESLYQKQNMRVMLHLSRINTKGCQVI